MICENCGKPIPEDARFCGSCGAPAPEPEAPEAPAPKRGGVSISITPQVGGVLGAILARKKRKEGK